MPRCNKNLFEIIPGGMLLALALFTATGSAQAESIYKVGNFSKSQATAPAIQVVNHGLGETPKALILWSAGGITVDFNLGFGFYDGTTQKSVSVASRDKRSTGEASSLRTEKALTIAEYDGSVVAEADIQSWDATSFTLNWTTNSGASTALHYIVIGGSDISARVVEWTAPASTGPTSVTGLGFQPDVVLHAFARLSDAEAQGIIGLGSMDGAGGQWGTTVYSVDGLADTDTQRGQTNSACLHAIDSDLSILRQASFVSMDSDGFTVNVTTAPAWTNNIISLALEGLSAQAGSFIKGIGTSQAITGVGFQPDFVIFSSFQESAQANPIPHSYFGFGASDGTTEGSSTISDTDALTQSDVHSRDASTKAFTKSNNQDGFVDASADLVSMDSNGYTLDWTTNDASATEILYLALGQQVLGSANISGVVFEDVDFAGTASDWDGGINDHALDNVDVELYDSGDTYISSVNTSGGGAFTFTNVPNGSYKVRVRSATIGDADTLPQGGLNLTVPATWPYPLPEMSWGFGLALIGGQDPDLDDSTTADDSGPGDTFVNVTVSGANVGGVNLGFNFDLIANVGDDASPDSVRSKQGSFRQFIKNSNAISGVNKSWFQMQSP